MLGSEASSVALRRVESLFRRVAISRADFVLRGRKKVANEQMFSTGEISGRDEANKCG